MRKISLIRISYLLFIAFFLFSSNGFALKLTKNTVNDNEINVLSSDEVLDPFIDLHVTVEIKKIRALEKIDLIGEPDFFVKIYINDKEYTSKIWYNQKYVNETWSVTQDVSNFEENVSIKIQLWDWNFVGNKLCDISGTDINPLNSYDVNLVYSLKTGHWRGDDFYTNEPILFDKSGYGRLNGCDDYSYNTIDRDCELFFDIYQNDFDNDGIPYWTEMNIYNQTEQCDPVVDDSGRDDDDDGIPIEWEHKWGHDFYQRWWHGPIEHRWFYHPFKWNDHKNLDPDKDGLDNIEEYLTSQWDSDPYRKDIFLEIDQMEIKEENGKKLGAFLPDMTKEMLKDGYSKHNIVLHVDDGCFGGGQIIPFDLNSSREELHIYYRNYFLNNDTTWWRRGVFHYGMIIYKADGARGNAFGTSIDGENYSIDSFQISTSFHEIMPMSRPIFDSIRRGTWDKEEQRIKVYAGVIMHEMGHTLGIFGGSQVPGCDDYYSIFPRINWFRFRNYKSCMNYNYVYSLVDYSDGSHGKNDHDDWGFIDLTLFQRQMN